MNIVENINDSIPKYFLFLMDAYDFFGGKTRLREHLVDLIKHARTHRNINPNELHVNAGLDGLGYSPLVVKDIEAGRVLIDKDYTMSCFSAIGIPIDTSMPLPELTREQKVYWLRKFKESGQCPVCGTTLDPSNTDGIEDSDEPIGRHLSKDNSDSEIALQLYI